MVKRKNKLLRNILVIGVIALIVLFFLFKETILLFIGGISSTTNNQTSTTEDTNVYSCSDTDDGLSYYMVGYAIDQNENRYYDHCEDTRVLTEYYCDWGKVKAKTFSCPSDYTCFETRSGGYCQPLILNEDGDILYEDSGSGSTTDPISNFEIDMSSISSGNCQLGALISTSWTYGNDFCQGIQSTEGITWTFYDSDSAEWTRTDLAPMSLGSDTGCGLDYNGQPFRLSMQKVFNLINCEIDYEYNVKIYACNCE